MRLFRPTYKDRVGQKKRAQKWYLDFFTAEGIRHRLPLFTDKRACEGVKNTIAECISCKVAGLAFEPELQRKLDVLPITILCKLVAWGLISNQRVAAGNLLSKHLQDWRQSLLSGGCTATYADLKAGRVRRIFERCGFRTYADISASKVQLEIARVKRTVCKKINGRLQTVERDSASTQTKGYYLKACRQFTRWMVTDRRAAEDPLRHLKAQAVIEQTHKRRSLEPDDIRRLLEATQAAGRRFGMDGHQRALLYRLAIETGLRADELRSLKVSSFDLDRYTVTVEAAYSKHRREDTVPLRKNTAAELKQYLANKMPTAQVFSIPDKSAAMFRADLAAAGIDYVDEAGRYADFHSLRHTTGSLLAASGAHPKVAQSIMRHSTIDLTMSRYTHIFRGQESEAVESLPDLSLPSREKQSAVKTGTDEKNVFANCLASSLHKQGVLGRTDLDCSGLNRDKIEIEKTALSVSKTAILAENHGKKEMRVLGFEPKTYGLKGRCPENISDANKGLMKSENPVFDTSLAKICAADPDFRLLAEAWPKLPERIKTAIKSLIESA